MNSKIIKLSKSLSSIGLTKEAVEIIALIKSANKKEIEEFARAYKSRLDEAAGAAQDIINKLEGGLLNRMKSLVSKEEKLSSLVTDMSLLMNSAKQHKETLRTIFNIKMKGSINFGNEDDYNRFYVITKIMSGDPSYVSTYRDPERCVRMAFFDICSASNEELTTKAIEAGKNFLSAAEEEINNIDNIVKRDMENKPEEN
jgi:uncharacterized protein (UPF0297 family)